jgi:hypothetical protein
MIKGSDRYGVFLIGLLVAASLLYFGFPRGVATVKALDGVRIASAMSKGTPQEPEDLRRLALSRAEALVWGADPVYARELSRSYHALLDFSGPDGRQSVVSAIRDASAAELTMRPLNAVAWWRLAVVTAAGEGMPQTDGATFLWHSVQVQPNAMSLIPLRLRTIIDHWGRFDAEQRPDVQPQFSAAWRRDPSSVMRLAENARRRAIIRAGLATEPWLLGAFEKALAKNP